MQQSINPTALAELTKTPGAGATGPGAGPGGISGGNENQVYTQAQLTQQREAAEREQQRLQQAAGRMSGYAGGLIQFWAPPVMSHMKGTPDDKSKSSATGGASSGSSSSSSAGSASGSSADSMLGAPLIKAGTILFAVLDTAVNSDYPDSPVLATIVDGKYKGAKLMGKLQITKGVSGQQDRIMLNFTLMNMDEWAKSKTSNAFAIDPDTARSALASSVNYHYMQRFGALMATSFLQGYGQAAMSSGGSQVASAFGTSSTNATLSPSSKMAVAVGQMAQAVGTATQNYTNRPPTVVVDSGVGLGILFMTDLS